MIHKKKVTRTKKTVLQKQKTVQQAQKRRKQTKNTSIHTVDNATQAHNICQQTEMLLTQTQNNATKAQNSIEPTQMSPMEAKNNTTQTQPSIQPTQVQDDVKQFILNKNKKDDNVQVENETTNKCNDEPESTIEEILEALNDQSLKALFYFKKFALNRINATNKKFQKQATLVHELYHSSVKLLNFFGKNYLTKAAYEKLENELTSLPTNFFKKKENFVELEQMNVGNRCKAQLQKPSISEFATEEVLDTCQNFYILICEQLYERLPFDDKFLENLKYLKPEFALCYSPESKTHCDKLIDCAAEFGCLDLDELRTDLNNLPAAFTDYEKELMKKRDFDDVWMEICSKQDKNGVMFPHLTEFVSIIRSLPHSNAEAERIFSILPDIITKKRNRMGTELANAICTVRSALKCKGLSCLSYEVTDMHFILMQSHYLYIPGVKETVDLLKLRSVIPQTDEVLL